MKSLEHFAFLVEATYFVTNLLCVSWHRHPVTSATDDLQRLAGTMLTRIRGASFPIVLDSVDETNGNIPIKGFLTRSRSDEEKDGDMITMAKAKGPRVEYAEDGQRADVFMTVSIGVSILRSEKLMKLKQEQLDNKKWKSNKNANGNDNDSFDRSPADWIQRADLSLQRAKKNGKNCVGALLEHMERPQDFRNDITSKWFGAAAKGEHSKILEMVKTGFSVDTLQVSYDSDTKLTALMTSAIHNHSEVARTLLRYNASINLQDEVESDFFENLTTKKYIEIDVVF